MPLTHFMFEMFVHKATAVTAYCNFMKRMLVKWPLESWKWEYATQQHLMELFSELAKI